MKRAVPEPRRLGAVHSRADEGIGRHVGHRRAAVRLCGQGREVALEGVEKVGGAGAYRLKLTLKDGTVQHVWIDQKSFLDVKVEGTPRRMDGRMRTVWITQRDFRSVQGVMLPFVMETAVDGYPGSHKIVIEKVALNPKLDDSRFTKSGT